MSPVRRLGNVGITWTKTGIMLSHYGQWWTSTPRHALILTTMSMRVLRGLGYASKLTNQVQISHVLQSMRIVYIQLVIKPLWIFPEARNLLNMARSTDLHGASNLTQLVKEISVVDLWALGTWYLSLLDSLQVHTTKTKPWYTLLCTTITISLSVATFHMSNHWPATPDGLSLSEANCGLHGCGNSPPPLVWFTQRYKERVQQQRYQNLWLLFLYRPMGFLCLFKLVHGPNKSYWKTILNGIGLTVSHFID